MALYILGVKMLKTPMRVITTGALFVGVPVYTATKVDPSQIMNALLLGGVTWLGVNTVMYIKDVLSEPLVEAFDKNDLTNHWTDGYLKARDEVGELARNREQIIRDYYENQLSSTGNEIKNITVTTNDYSTVNNVNTTPQLEDNIIDKQLLKG